MRNPVAVIVCVVAVVITTPTAWSQHFRWAVRLGGTSFDMGRDVALDTSGNVYTVGRFQGTVDFDPGPGTFNLTSAGLDDVFLSKLDSAGNFVWAVRLGGTSFDDGHGVALDTNGNVYAVGTFQGTVDFDPGPGTFNLTSAGSADTFVSKLDAAGNFVWAVRVGGAASFDEGREVALDTSGNVYAVGTFQGTADFDPGPGTFNLTSAGDRDAFIFKLGSAGNFGWAARLGGTSTDTGMGVALDTSGNVYTVGGFQGTADFDPGPGTFNLTSAGSFDTFVSKLDSAGNFVWGLRLGGTSDDGPIDMALDTSGNIYTVGRFQGTADFDPGPGTFSLTSAGDSDAFISKLDSAGNLVWAVRLGGALFDEGRDVAVDTSGSVHTVGRFQGTADFDPGAASFNLTSAGDFDAFVSKLVPCSDLDGDGFGNPGNSTCPNGNGLDCDDGNSAVHPGAAELCNAVDDNCDILVDEGLGSTVCGVGACERTVANCVNGQIQTCTPGSPAPEICDGIDNDCNGSVDDGLGSTTCGVGACERTVQNCVGGQVQTCTPGSPSTEVCDGIDNDCNGSVDEGLGSTTCGVGGCQRTVQNCVAGQIQICTPGPPSSETCNNVDDNCDGSVDEGVCVGKATGGGEIDVPGGTANFGFVAQRKVFGDPVMGQLEYYNHARALNVHSTSIQTLTVSGNVAMFTGQCTKNQAPCTFSVMAEDIGEPGGDVDKFSISVSGEPVEGAVNAIRRGNIQIHTSAGAGVESLAAGVSTNTLAGAGSGVYSSGVSFEGIPITGLHFGTGANVPGDGSADGTFETTLLGVSPLGLPQTITLDTNVASGYATDDGNVYITGVCRVDMGDGSPPRTGVPLSLVAATGGQEQDTLSLVVDSSSLPAATIDHGSFTRPACSPEVGGSLSFADAQTLTWLPETVFSYNVYRGSISGLWNYNHVCLEASLTNPGASDSTVPPVSTAFYYLVSGVNACGEGSLGDQSDGQPRPNSSPCP